MAGQDVSSRVAGQIYAAYQQGNAKTREWIATNPELVSRAQPEPPAKPPERPEDALMRDVEVLGAICRRARKRLGECATFDDGFRALLHHNLDMAQVELGRLLARAKGEPNAG